MHASGKRVQVITKRCKEFLGEMDAEAIATQLLAQGLITQPVDRSIKQSNSKEESNSHLLTFLKEGASADQVQECLKYATEAKGHGRMNAFAARILQEIQQGLQ